MDLSQPRLFNNIYLIGYRCTGKTHVGRILSQELGLSFVDMDEEIGKQENQTISELVREHGWEYFRKREKEVLERLSESSNQVIATGGGVVLDSNNIEMIQNTGFSVWLKASLETIEKRMALDLSSEENRPPLTSNKLSQEIDETLQERNPFYEKTMDFSVDTDHENVESICEKIINQLNTINMNA